MHESEADKTAAIPHIRVDSQGAKVKVQTHADSGSLMGNRFGDGRRLLPAEVGKSVKAFVS